MRPDLDGHQGLPSALRDGGPLLRLSSRPVHWNGRPVPVGAAGPYDVVVASPYQTPVDPFEQLTSHRPFDCWGRDAVDHMLGRLPAVLASDGVAYVLHLSILSQRRTMELLAQHGLTCSIADFEFFPITEHSAEAMPQIEKVIAQSDAHLLDIGGSRDRRLPPRGPPRLTRGS